MKIRLIAATFIFVLAGMLQNTGFFVAFGIKPNLLLVAMVAISFFIKDIWTYLSFVLAAVVLVIVGGGIALEQIVLAGLGLAAFPVGRYLHWQPFFNNFLMIGAGTVLFYLLTAPAFLISDWQAVVGEIVYNLVWGWIFFELFSRWLKTNSILRI